MNKLSDYITFNSDGLVPVIAQEYKSNIVLMLAYASKEALDLYFEEAPEEKKILFTIKSDETMPLISRMFLCLRLTVVRGRL